MDWGSIPREGDRFSANIHAGHETHLGFRTVRAKVKESETWH
jgi:hypothetical protein